MTGKLVVEVEPEISVDVEVADGAAAVIGREPQVTSDLLAMSRSAPRTVTIPEPSVSSNHLLVQQRGAVTILRDLESRNSSWLRLPPGESVEVHTSTQLHIRLASPSRPVAETPEDARWLRAEEYARGVTDAITAWLGRMEIAARVMSRVGTAVQDHELQHRIPLANGSLVEVTPRGTVDARWTDVMTTLWRYVNAQNAIYRSEEETRDEGLVLQSPAIRQAHKEVVHAAQRGMRLLLIGPSGAGKDGLARVYHRSTRRGGAFVSKNCSMFQLDLLRAELFGSEPGAFTSAVRRIVGAVESAHGGTLFLDEIGEMSLEVQPSLLTFLDRGEYERLGGYDHRRVADVRLVSATNKDLRQATRSGSFREDLWYRIAGHVVEVPPLHDRPEDVEGFLRRQMLGARVDAWSALGMDGRAEVLAHPWHGNFRELASFAARLPSDAEHGSIRAATCRAALAVGMLTRQPIEVTQRGDSPSSGLDLAALGGKASAFYREDFGEIQKWDDVKQYVERYLKPIVFAAMSGAQQLSGRDAADIPTCASATDADRGTALKQLNRYFERFKR